MLPGGWIGPAAGAAGDTMGKAIGRAVTDDLRAPVALGRAPGVQPAVPALLGTVVAQTSVLDAQLLLVVPHSKLLASRATLGYAAAEPHLPRPLSVHSILPEVVPGPALRPESAGFDSQRGRDCTRDGGPHTHYTARAAHALFNHWC